MKFLASSQLQRLGYSFIKKLGLLKLSLRETGGFVAIHKILRISKGLSISI